MTGTGTGDKTLTPDSEGKLKATTFNADGSVNVEGSAHNKPYIGGLKLAWIATSTDDQVMKNFKLPIKKASDETRITGFDDQDDNAKKVYVYGNLTVSLANADVVLLSQSTFAAAEKDPATALAGKDGKKATVKFGKREIKQGIWTPIVLPFATSVKEVSEKLGYAVVDIMEAKGDGNVHFTLHLGDIPANTPFIVKAYADCDLAGVTGDANGYGAQAAVEFEKTIDFTTNIDATTKNAVVKDGAIQFIGVYAQGTSIYGSNNRYCSSSTGTWNYPNTTTYTAENQMTIPTMKAYLHFGDNQAHTIYIQEPDGSTTAIEAIEADGMVVATDGWYTLNGMKLNSVPTEKGVYIHNGKKVVLK